MGPDKWTCVVITCTNTEWASTLRIELDTLHRQGLLCTETCYVVEDPAADVGSGGATLNALLVAVERLCNFKGYTTVSSDVLLNSNILIIHHGRTSCYWPMGKVFFPLSTPNKNQSGLQTYLEYIVELCSQLRVGAVPGIWIASTDINLSGKILAKPDWSSFPQHGGILFSVKATRRESRYCGRVTELGGIVQSLTYEQGRTNDYDTVEVVGGILYLKPQLCEALLSLHTIPPVDCATYLGVDSGEVPLKVSLYFDLLLPLCKGIRAEDYIDGIYNEKYCRALGLPNDKTQRHVRARTILWDVLNSFSLGAFCLSGLSQRYWTDCAALEELLDLKVETDAWHASVLHSGPVAISHALNSYVNVEIAAGQNPPVCIHSRISGERWRFNCPGSAFFLNCHIDFDQVREFTVPENAVFVGYKISVQNAVHNAIAIFSSTDVPLLPFRDPLATLFGTPWPQFFARKGIAERDLWDDDHGTHFNARLYPLPQSRTDWRNLLWLCTAESTATDSVRLHSWRTSPRYSLKDFVQLSSPRAYFNDARESVASAVTSSLTRWQGSFLPYFRKACAEGWADRMLEALDKCASESSDPVRASRFLAAIADLLGCMADDEGGLRSGPASNIQWADAFYLLEFSTLEEGIEALARQRKQWMGNAERLVRAARHYERAVQIVIRNTVKSVKRLMPSPVDQKNCRPDFDVWVESCCPARIDLSGGWSDTPPICYEMGGSVVNLAILVDGKRPIGSKARRLREPVLVLRHEETCEALFIDKLDEALNYVNPLAVGALMKASLVCAGVVQPKGNLQEQLLNNLGGGLELQCWSCLPKGSGLGTSSIMAATLLAVIYTAMGVTFTRSSLIHGVLYVEQLLTTGGGWQDQVSGVIGGANRGHSPASSSVSVGVERIPLRRSTVAALNSHLILMHTGKVRLARNLLQNVIRNWYVRDDSTLTCFRELVRNSMDCAESLAEGDLAQLGKCVDIYWDQKKLLAPGCEPALVAELMAAMKPLVYGQSLTGAGGGGFYFAVAREPVVKNLFEKTIASISEGSNLSVHQVEVDEGGITLQIGGQDVDIL